MVLKCRNCNKDLEDVIDFGRMPIANAFINLENKENEYFFNLTSTVCPNCLLFQLKEQTQEKML